MIYDIVRCFDKFDNKAYFIVRKLWELGKFLKKDCFSYEKEYRFLITFIHDPDNKKTPRNDEFRVAKGVLVPYQRAFFKPEALKEINCSPTLESERALSGIRNLLYSYGYAETITIGLSKIPVRF
jgi:hypothetical protein